MVFFLFFFQNFIFFIFFIIIIFFNILTGWLINLYLYRLLIKVIPRPDNDKNKCGGSGGGWGLIITFFKLFYKSILIIVQL